MDNAMLLLVDVPQGKTNERHASNQLPLVEQNVPFCSTKAIMIE